MIVTDDDLDMAVLAASWSSTSRWIEAMADLLPMPGGTKSLRAARRMALKRIDSYLDQLEWLAAKRNPELWRRR
jgi:hypothetical protein